MQDIRRLLVLASLLAAPLVGRAQEAAAPRAPAEPTAPPVSFEGATGELLQKLKGSVDELAQLRAQIAAEQVPLSKQLSALETELSEVRAQFQQTSRLLDSRTLDLSNLRTTIKTREEEAGYVSNLLSDYIRNFEAGLHIAELQRYEASLEATQLAADNTSLSQEEIFTQQTALLGISLARLEEAIGGARFEGDAVVDGGLVEPGTFVLVGPLALFRSADGKSVGTAEQRVGSLEPTVVAFAQPEDAEAAGRVIARSEGEFPLDPTLGNAHKLEATSETLVEHLRKGGEVMIPIIALAAAALLVALYKWISLSFVPRLKRRKLEGLLAAVGAGDEAAAREQVAAIRGPIGAMLAAGVEHLREPRELIEEVMYEKVLMTRLKLQRLLPFIAITAASAPLLGLLGTVTGIINTFKMITVFGSSDVKSLSGGISEALITTKFGLIVAIPSLLLHAFLSRKARGVTGQMEASAVALVNGVGKSRSTASEGPGGPNGVDPELLRSQIDEVLQGMMDERVAARDREDLGGEPAQAASGQQATAEVECETDRALLVPRPARRD